jgi:STE24 endopeptidase
MTRDPPEELKGHYSKEHIIATRAYSLDKKNYGLVKGAFDFCETFFVLWFMLLPVTWRMAERAVESVKPGWGSNEYAASIGFTLLTIVFEMLKGLPWSLYFTFVIEQRHGFNKQTIGLFFLDTLKSVRRTAWLVCLQNRHP